MKFSPILGMVILVPCMAAGQTLSEPVTMPAITVTPSELGITRPGAVDELTGRDLLLRSIDRIEDLQSRTPNLVSRSGGTRSLNLVLGFRGLVNNAFYGEPAVALYVDDVPYASTLSYDTSLLEISRVELFRGPQFTRWGRQGPGGLIAIYSRPPGDRLGVRAEAGFASYDEQYYKLHVDGPLGPNLKFSLSGMYSRRDGYLHNALTNIDPDYQEGFNGRFSMEWRPSERFQIKFIVGGQYADDGLQRFTNLDSTPGTIEQDFNGKTKTRSDVESLQVRYFGEEVMLTSITARRNFRLDPASIDLDFSPLPIFPGSVFSEQLQYSQEFRLQPMQEGRLGWFVGAYASHTDLEVTVDDNVFRGDSEMIDQALALYGEITWKTDCKVDVTLGARGEWVDKSAERTLRQPDGTSTHEDRGRTISNLSPKLGLAWHMSDNVLFHGSTSLSYRSGAYSVFNFNPEILSARTERTWANEVGAKIRLLEDKLEVALTGFWSEISHYQIERYLLGGFGVFSAEEVRSRGVELEILSRPVQGLELSAAVGYIDVEFTKHRSLVTGDNLAGRRPPYIPNVTANFAAQYRHDSGLVARVEWLLTGRTFFDEDNVQSAAQSAYGLLNAKIGFEQEHWAIYLYGKNLTDTEYNTLKVPALGVGVPSEPRVFGMMVTTTF